MFGSTTDVLYSNKMFYSVQKKEGRVEKSWKMRKKTQTGGASRGLPDGTDDIRERFCWGNLRCCRALTWGNGVPLVLCTSVPLLQRNPNDLIGESCSHAHTPFPHSALDCLYLFSGSCPRILQGSITFSSSKVSPMSATTSR